MEPSPQKMSPLEFVAAILKGDYSSGGQSEGLVAMLMENKDLVMVLTTSVAVLIGCVVVLAWRRASGSGRYKQPELPKLVVPKAAEPEDVDDDKTKISVFFGTQTGTAEGFAKVGSRCLLFRELEENMKV